MMSVLVISLFLLSFPSSLVSDGAPAPTSDRGGSFHDGFFDASNVTMDGDAVLKGTALTLDNTIWADEFDRADPAPWIEIDNLNQATMEIENEQLKLVGGSSPYAWIKADRAINQREVKVTCQVMTTVVGNEGASLEILSTTGYGLDLDYYRPGGELRLKVGSRGNFHSVMRKNFNHQTNVWYDISIAVTQEGDIHCDWGGTVLTGTMALSNHLAIVSLGMERGGTAHYDNVTLLTSHVDGTATSSVVDLPTGMEWEGFSMSDSAPTDSSALVSILDGSNMDPVPGFEAVPVASLDLGGVDPSAHTNLAVRVYMVAFAFDMPSIDSWTIAWTEARDIWLETFDDGSGVSLTGDAEVSGGGLRTANLIARDGFTRLDLTPWRVEVGVAEIREGCLWTGNPLTSLSRVHLATSQFTKAQLTMRMMPLALSTGGPRMELTTTGAETYIFDYIRSSNLMRIMVDDGSSTVLASGPLSFSTGSWYDVQIEYTGSTLVFTVGSRTVQALRTVSAPFDGLSLSNLRDEQTYWDDLEMAAPFRAGTATMAPIMPPDGKGWMNLSIEADLPTGSVMNVTILDGDSLEPLAGMVNMTGDRQDLSSVNPRDHPTIRLLIRLEGVHARIPIIDWMSIDFDWVVDAVHQIRAFDDITMYEDVPMEGILNLTDYFRAKYSSPEDLTYDITRISDPEWVFPRIMGMELAIDLPTENWFGEATFRVNCSSPERSLETTDIRVVVLAVNDPPTVGDLDVFEAVEDQPSVLDMSRYISDVDNPLEDLRILPRDDHVTADGLNLTFRFSTGGDTLTVMLEIADDHSRAYANLTVVVRETNDPPIVYGVSRKLFMEDEADTVDLTVYVEDEDTPRDDIVLVCDHHAVVGITGFNITLLYTRWEPDHNVTFMAFDGATYTNGSFLVRVEERNDPPVILGLGAHEPPITISMDEGTELWLPVRVEDEDSFAFDYTVESTWNGATVFSNGTVRITTLKGEVGEFKITLTVDDLVGGKDGVTVTVEVLNVNDPPFGLLLLQPHNHTQVEEGTNITFKVEVYDPDIPLGDVVIVTWSSNVSGIIGTLTTEVPLTFSNDILPVGDHRVTVTATDGEHLTEIWFDLMVIERYQPPPPEPEELSFLTDPIGIAAIVLVVVLVVIVVGLLIARSRAEDLEEPEVKGPPPETLIAEVEEEPAKDLEAHREADGTPWEETPQLESLSVPVPPPVEVEVSEAERADRLHATQVREVGKVLTQLPRGLPTALWSKDLSELARDIVDGPKRNAPDGTLLVQVDGHWYNADHTNVGTFLQEHREEREAHTTPDKDERAKKLAKLEDRLLEGSISEETYQELRKKYE